jgi:diguanylate cyclase (GGDEF)-like protein/PAS domain S-box-containing protein
MAQALTSQDVFEGPASLRLTAPRNAEELRILLVGLVGLAGLAALEPWPLLFHSGAEVFFAVAATSILAVAWHLRPLVDDDYPLFIGIALTFAAGVQLMHAATYPGMAIFRGSTADISSQLTVSGRFLSAISLLIAPLVLKRRIRATWVVLAYLLAVVLLVCAIAWWRVFPTCRTAAGITGFKKGAEYASTALLMGAMLFTVRRRHLLHPGTSRFVLAALACALLSAISFSDPYPAAIVSTVGHLFADAAVYFMVVGVAYRSIVRPMTISFAVLREREQQALSQAKSSLAELRDYEQRERALFDSANLGMLAFGRDLVITECNDRLSEIMGVPRVALLGHDMKQAKESFVLPALQEALSGRVATYDGVYHRRAGGEVWISARTSPLFDAAGEVAGGIALIADTTAGRRAEELVERLAFRDPVTELPNRTLLRDRIRQAVDGAERNGRKVAVCVLDLDRFKNVNDTLGTGAGEKVLQEVALRIGAIIRRGDTLARIGGDEFAVLMPTVRSARDTIMIADKIVAACRQPWEVAGQRFYTTASVGVAVYPDDSSDAHGLLENADTAMRRAKEMGRDRCQFYEADMNAFAATRLASERDLRAALELGQFVVYYQPQVDLRTQRIVGAEALARWQHPTRGLVMPAEFIPLAEETGLIAPLDEWLTRRACADIAALGHGLRLAVNVSARELRSQGLLPAIEQALAQSGLSPQQLEVEITETAIMADPENARRLLDELRAHKLSVALDDFGTGFSSLSHLHQLPINRVKIDRSFVSHIEDDRHAAAIVTAVTQLARSLELAVMAEGVETEQQREFLLGIGCSEAQGYLLGRPMPLAEFRASLIASQALSSGAVT